MNSLLWAVLVGAVVGALAHYLPRYEQGHLGKDVVLGIAGSVASVYLSLVFGLFYYYSAGYYIVGLIGSLFVLGLYWIWQWRVSQRELEAAEIAEAAQALIAEREAAAHATQAVITDQATKAALKRAEAQRAEEERAEAELAEAQRAATSPSIGKIFLSYASADREFARTLASALLNEGWYVWWDRSIPPGKTFAEVIEGALNAATCVIVLWSTASVNSDWVKNEAREGLRRRILIPAATTEVTIPFEFRHIQAADLTGWPSSGAHAGFQSLVASVRGMLAVGKSADSTGKAWIG